MDLVIYAHLRDLWCCRCTVYHTSIVVTYKLAREAITSRALCHCCQSDDNQRVRLDASSRVSNSSSE